MEIKSHELKKNEFEYGHAPKFSNNWYTHDYFVDGAAERYTVTEFCHSS